jgi:hypothetical protein
MNFVLFIADRHMSTIGDENFSRNDQLDPDKQTKAKVFEKLRAKNVPVIQFGHAGSFIKSANFDAQIDDQIRSALVSDVEKARRARIELSSLPDPAGRQGRAIVENYTFFSGISAELTLLGNFIFNWGQTVWLDFFDIHPISGLFVIIGHEESVSSEGFTTKLKVMTTGTDPLNTRRKLTRSQLEQARLDQETAQKKKEGQKQQKKRTPAKKNT